MKHRGARSREWTTHRWFSHLLLLLVGCAAPPPIFPPVEPPLVFPRVGDAPRFRYVGSLRGEADLGRPRSVWEWLGAIWGGDEPMAEISLASDVAHTADDVLYVADPGAHVVHRFDLEHREYRALTEAAGGRRFVTPIGLALAGERLVVADRSLGTVTVLSPAGVPQTVLGAGGIQGPVGVCVGPLSGRIFVADVPSHVVAVFRPTGEVDMVIGRRGEGPGEFNFPTHVACDASENLYVTDTLNCRVQVFDSAGSFLRSWGHRGNRPGEFSCPKGVACDKAGRVYVVDSHFENVQVYTPEGAFLLAFGEEGNDPGQFWLPVGVCIDETNRIWVGDSFNRRVQVFQYIGQDNVRGLAP